MAKHTNLSSLFTDIADAIRTKKGTTGEIVADNFPDEIAGIEGGSAGDYEVLWERLVAPISTTRFSIGLYNDNARFRGRYPDLLILTPSNAMEYSLLTGGIMLMHVGFKSDGTITTDNCICVDKNDGMQWLYVSNTTFSFSTSSDSSVFDIVVTAGDTYACFSSSQYDYLLLYKT